MRTSVGPLRLFPALLAVAGVGLLGPLAGPGRAEKPQVGAILFKDGFSLQGYIVREKKTITDSATGQPFQLAEGFFLVDDLARHIIFSPAQIQKVLPEAPFNPDADALSRVTSIDLSVARPLPPIRELVEAGPFDESWNRTFQYRTTDRPVTAKQHLAVLSPYYARLDCVPRLHGVSIYLYRWNAYYLTRELGPEQVRRLLYLHPQLKESQSTPEEERATRRLKAARFLLACGWPDEARADLEQLARDLPGQKSRVDAELDVVRRAETAQRAQDLRLAYRAGQFERAHKALADFPTQGVDEQVLTDVRQLRTEADTAAENVEQAHRFLKELPDKLSQLDQQGWLPAAAAAVRAEVAPDTVGRLETFLGQAKQADRQRQQGKTPELVPQQLLALAVSGWLLGNTAAEAKIEAAERLWRTRQFVLEYQRTEDRASRQKLLAEYERKGSGALALDELGQLIGTLPPPEPEEKLDRVPREVKVKDAGGQEIAYWLQLPREYSHGRSYPLLLALHMAGETPRAALDRWSELAGQYGYVLAAPEWAVAGQTEYAYSAREHHTVLDALGDLRRHFAVDSDRVFLAGCGQGGDMAYDVGLAHPDLFAGVVPMSAFPGPMPYRYRHNAQYLPFYVIVGDRSGDNGDNRALFKEWVPHGYPVLYVQYRGRGLEWFAGELPAIFDWMDRKKRANPQTVLGNYGNDEFTTMRSGDNRFYWLSVDAVDERQLNEGPRFNPRLLGASLQGTRGGNQITVHAQSVRRLTVWFRSGDGATDFDKPVAIYVNATKRFERKVTPSRETLLEDLYARGDRQRLYVARVELDVR
jgi:pimeloyl-ACP methyl ester carboxylesterase